MWLFATNDDIIEKIDYICPYCGNKKDFSEEQIIKRYFAINCKAIIIEISCVTCLSCNNYVYPKVFFPFINYLILYIISVLTKNIEAQKKTHETLLLHSSIVDCNSIKYQGEKIDVFFEKINKSLIDYNAVEKKMIKFIFQGGKNTDLVKEEKITSLEDYIKLVSKIRVCNKLTWYRGQSNIEYKLIPSVHRIYENDDYEQRIIKFFMLRAPGLTNNCPAEQCYHQWLPFMQHYELPTRLLDWTDSPLCALFFALLSDNKSDACVYVFDPIEWNFCQYSIGGIPIIDTSEEDELKKIINNAFERKNNLINIKPMAITSIRKYNRMYNQQANFTIHDSNVDMYSLLPSVFTKIIIPNNYKKSIRYQLFDMGIDKTTFFPELTALAEVTKKFA